MRKIAIPIIAFLIGSLGFLSCDDDEETTLIGNWKDGSDFEGNPRSSASCFVINGKAYLVGGFDGDDFYQDTWEYDPELNWWKQMSPFPGKARSAGVAFTINGKGDAKLNDFWEFDAQREPQWVQKTDFGGLARYAAVGFAIGNYGYIGTGYNDNGDSKDFWKYDPSTDKWTQITSVGGSKRRSACTFVINGYAYLGTGINNGSYETDFWKFDASVETWTEMLPLDNDDSYSIVRSGAVTFTLNGKGYIGTGYTSGYTSTIWEYDPTTDLWNDVTGFEGSARGDAVGFSIGDKGYITTGKNGSYYFDDIWSFNPTEEYDGDD